MPRADTHLGEKLFTEYEEKGAKETVALHEWKRVLDRCDGDGFKAARTFKSEQPALFKTLEESHSFEELVEIAGLMSGNDVEGEFF